MPDSYEIKIQAKGSAEEVSFIAEGKIDLVDRFDHNFVTKFTDVPLEDGSSIVDHAVDDPKRIRVSIVVSNIHTQSELLEQTRSKYAEAIEARQEEAQELFLNEADYLSEIEIMALEAMNHIEEVSVIVKGRPVSALDDLLELQRNRTLLTVSSLLHVYDDMVIEKIRTREDLRNGNALHAEIEMRQILFAKPVLGVARSFGLDPEKMTPQQALTESIARNKALEEERRLAEEVKLGERQAKAFRQASEEENIKIQRKESIDSLLDGVSKITGIPYQGPSVREAKEQFLNSRR